MLMRSQNVLLAFSYITYKVSTNRNNVVMCNHVSNTQYNLLLNHQNAPYTLCLLCYNLKSPKQTIYYKTLNQFQQQYVNIIHNKTNYIKTRLIYQIFSILCLLRQHKLGTSLEKQTNSKQSMYISVFAHGKRSQKRQSFCRFSIMIQVSADKLFLYTLVFRN